MSRKETPKELEINKVLKYQEERLDAIQFPELESVDQTITSAEQLLASLGYKDSLPARGQYASIQTKKSMIIPSWNTLVSQANASVQGEYHIEDFFSADELKMNSEVIKALNPAVTE